MKQYQVLTFASAAGSLFCSEFNGAMNKLASQGYVLAPGTYKVIPVPVNIDQRNQTQQFVFTCVMEKTMEGPSEQ
jgi:hypothetical protein